MNLRQKNYVKGWYQMVRVYDIHHIRDGTELIKDPLHLTSAQLKDLERRKDQVALDQEFIQNCSITGKKSNMGIW